MITKLKNFQNFQKNDPLAKSEFHKMLKMRIICRSSSPWAFPLHLVPKASGGWQPCGDYRRLNVATQFDRYPIPHIQDFSTSLEGATIFSKIDSIRGYHQVLVGKAGICKTTVITPFGLFEFFRMQFDLKNAAQAFQRLMDFICNSLNDVFVNLDDILMASPTPQAHQQNLQQLFQRLANYELVINLAKREFARSHLDFLGHRIDKTGVTPLPASIEAICNFPRPLTTKDPQDFWVW